MVPKRTWRGRLHGIAHSDHDCLQAPIVFSGITFIVGAAIMAGAVHISMIIIGRLILGLGVGVGTTASCSLQALHCSCRLVPEILQFCRPRVPV